MLDFYLNIIFSKILYYVKNILQKVKIKILFGRFDETLTSSG